MPSARILVATCGEGYGEHMNCNPTSTATAPATTNRSASSATQGGIEETNLAADRGLPLPQPQMRDIFQEAVLASAAKS